jgi:7-carboxy-7-deazaguanine synthase
VRETLQNTKYKIVEIFNSIQGEGANLGKEVTFIRLSGCNLKCSWCDTEHNNYYELTAKEISLACKENVIITGGEPTIHNLIPLLEALQGKWIGIETNGTNDIAEIRKYINYIAFSPKGNVDKSLIETADEIRIVNDDITVKEVMKYEDWKIKNRYISVLEKDNKYNLEETIKLIGKLNERSRHNWRLNQQYHKLLKIR